MHTTIKANAEYGRVRSNNPRSLPPLDYITGYFDGVVNKGGYNPWSFDGNAQTGGVGSFSTKAYGGKATQNLSPWVNGQDVHYAWPGPNACYWYDAATDKLVDSMTTLNGQNAPGGLPNNSYLAAMTQVMPLYTSGFKNYAMTVNQRDSSLFPGAYAGTAIYSDKSLTDSSVFDFYNNLIDGDTKREWQNWKTFNITADQSFFNGRLSFQATFDHQEFDNGQEGLLTGYSQPFITVDLDAYKLVYPAVYPQAVANENVGRALIASDCTNSNTSTRFVHDNRQLVANGELRASDFMDPQSLATKMIGTHSFTGLYGEYKTRTDSRSWSMYAADVPFSDLTMGDKKGLITNRAISWVAYLGGSMQNLSSASGLNLSPLTSNIVPRTGTIQHFDSTWTAGSAVDPAAPWVNPADPTGTYEQNDNPANFAGWKSIPIGILNSEDDIEDLYQTGTKRLERLTSTSFMYQGKLFDDIVMPMFGYRKDKVRQRSSNAPLDANTHIASMNYEITGDDAVEDTISRSYGVTLHLPKSLRKNLPLGTDLSLHYFHGANSTPKIRYGFDANQIASEYGKTDDYGFQLDTFNDRLTLRVTYFKTQDFNAAAGSGVADPLGANGYYLYLLPAWGFNDAAGIGYKIDNNNVGSYAWSVGAWDNTIPATSVQTAAVNDWVTKLQEKDANGNAKYFSQAFFDAYGLAANVSQFVQRNWTQSFGASSVDLIANAFGNVTNQGAGKVNGSFPIISQDVEAKGWEIEATVRPVKNWDITFNVSKVQAVQTAIGASSEAFIMMQKEFFDGPAGDIHLWGWWSGTQDANSTLRRTFYQNVWAAYCAQKAQLGCSQPELRDWNAKVITNYTFNNGFLKGVNVGGGYRWGNKPIIGYGVHQIDDGFGNMIYISDKDQPLYGWVDQHFDFWVGYGRKLTDKIDWHIQLNIQNVLEDARLAPVTRNPDGAVAQWRILQGQTFTLTNTFKF